MRKWRKGGRRPREHQHQSSQSGCQQRRRTDDTKQIRVGRTRAVLVMVLESRLEKATSRSRA